MRPEVPLQSTQRANPRPVQSRVGPPETQAKHYSPRGILGSIMGIEILQNMGWDYEKVLDSQRFSDARWSCSALDPRKLSGLEAGSR